MSIRILHPSHLSTSTLPHHHYAAWAVGDLLNQSPCYSDLWSKSHKDLTGILEPPFRPWFGISPKSQVFWAEPSQVLVNAPPPSPWACKFKHHLLTPASFHSWDYRCYPCIGFWTWSQYDFSAPVLIVQFPIVATVRPRNIGNLFPKGTYSPTVFWPCESIARHQTPAKSPEAFCNEASGSCFLQRMHNLLSHADVNLAPDNHRQFPFWLLLVLCDGGDASWILSTRSGLLGRRMYDKQIRPVRGVLQPPRNYAILTIWSTSPAPKSIALRNDNAQTNSDYSNLNGVRGWSWDLAL